MKKSILVLIFVISGLLLFDGCGRDKKLSHDQVHQLIQKMNQAPIGLAMKVNPDDIQSESSVEGRFQITLKNPSLTFNTSVYKDLNMGDKIKPHDIPIKVGEIVFEYGPEENHLILVSANDVELDWDFSKFVSMPEKDIDSTHKNMKMKMSARRIKFNNYNTSALLNPNMKTFLEIICQLAKINSSTESTIEGGKFEMNFLIKEGNQTDFVFSFKKAEGVQIIYDKFITALYSKETVKLDLPKMLANGAAILDLHGKIHDLQLQVKQNQEEIVYGKLASISVKYSLKPDSQKKSFVFGVGWESKDLKVLIPKNKALELAFNLNSIKTDFSLANLSPAIIESYINMVRSSMGKTYISTQEKQQAMMQQGMNMGQEFVKSKPIIKFSIPDFQHYFGNITGNSQFQFITMGPPVGKATATILNIDAVKKKLEEEKSLPPNMIKWLLSIFDQFFVKNQKGDGTITFEIKQDQPGVFYLNGKLIRT